MAAGRGTHFVRIIAASTPPLNAFELA